MAAQMTAGAIAVGVLAVIGSTAAIGYELGTHARITLNALQQSNLEATAKLTQMGFSDDINQAFRNVYFDISGAPSNAARVRYSGPFDFSNARMPGVSQDPKLPTYLQGWLMQGLYVKTMAVLSHIHAAHNRRMILLGRSIGFAITSTIR